MKPLRSLWLSGPTLIGVVSIIFFIMRVIPGDPVSALYGDSARPEVLRQLRESMGLNRPLAVQYLDYLRNAATGDLGISFRTHRPVVAEIVEAFPHTLALGLGGILIAIVLGVPLGVLASVYHGSKLDYVSMAVALVGVSVPIFWLGILLMIIFAVTLKWLPLMGAGDAGLADVMIHLILPAGALGLAGAGWIARITRSSMLDVLSQDYIWTARAKGAAEGAVIFRHALKNALPPIVTVTGLLLARLLGGAIVTEVIFARPGLGKLLVDAILQRDYPQVQGTVTFVAVLVILVNVVVDTSYALLDPRVRSG